MQTYGGEHTGRATIMLSYTWGYTFGAIGSALMAFCAKHGLDPRTTHVWICCMCINQHRVAGGPAGANRACAHMSTNCLRHLRRQDGDAGGAEARVREPRARHRPHRLDALSVGRADQPDAHLVRCCAVGRCAPRHRRARVRRRCVFELWIAVTMEGCKLDLIMPASEGERFNETLVKDFGSIAKTLANVRAFDQSSSCLPPLRRHTQHSRTSMPS